MFLLALKTSVPPLQQFDLLLGHEINYLTAVTATILLIATKLVLAADNGLERTLGLTALLLCTSYTMFLNCNQFVAVSFCTLELGMVTAIILLQQAFYEPKSRDFAPFLFMAALPVTAVFNDYFIDSAQRHSTSGGSQEAARSLFRSILIPEETFSVLVLLLLALSGFFVAILLSIPFGSRKFSNKAAARRSLSSGKFIIFKKYTNVSKSKLIKPNLTVI